MKIAVLNADRTPPQVQKAACDVTQLYKNFLAHNGNQVTFFDVQNGEYPHGKFEVYVITGSPASAYENRPWINTLKDYICQNRSQKLLGICFGHQIIAQTLGGKVEKSPQGWSLGVQNLAIANEQSWMQPQRPHLHAIFNHQDQVTLLPSGATLLGSTQKVPLAMYCLNDNIFCMQCHPEFTRLYQLALMHKNQDTTPDYLLRQAENSYRQLTPATEILYSWIFNFFNV